VTFSLSFNLVFNPAFRYLYRPQAVVDGNFKLDNLKMRNPGDDVRLSDGEMFCVGSVLYDEHVRITPEKKQVRPWDGFLPSHFAEINWRSAQTVTIIVPSTKPMQNEKMLTPRG
jgi:hypothetical protein